MWIKTSQNSGRLISVARSPSTYGKQMILWLLNNTKKEIPMISSINNWREIKILQLLQVQDLISLKYRLLYMKLKKNKIKALA